MKRQRKIITVLTTLFLTRLVLFGMSCSSLDAASFLSRNACDIFNCDVLFFVDDIFPLAGGPVSASGGMDMAAEEEESAGHMH